MSLTKCGWCHTMVEKPCTTVVEGKLCREPYTLTAEQSEQFYEAARGRVPLQAKPLPIEDCRKENS